jgi:hypothetical protein
MTRDSCVAELAAGWKAALLKSMDARGCGGNFAREELMCACMYGWMDGWMDGRTH